VFFCTPTRPPNPLYKKIYLSYSRRAPYIQLIRPESVFDQSLGWQLREPLYKLGGSVVKPGVRYDKVPKAINFRALAQKIQLKNLELNFLTKGPKIYSFRTLSYHTHRTPPHGLRVPKKSQIVLLSYILDHGFMSQIEPVDGQVWLCFLGAKAGFLETENLTCLPVLRTGSSRRWAVHAGTVRPKPHTATRALRGTPSSRRHE